MNRPVSALPAVGRPARVARHVRPLVALTAIAAIALAACTSGGGASPSGAAPSGAAPSGAASSGEPAGNAAPLEGTAWQLTDYVGPENTTVPVPKGAAATATFTAGRIAGNAGCNQYTGAYTLDGEKISISGLAMTAMACPDIQMALEQAYTTALEKAASYAISGNTLELRTADGTVGLRYTVATAPSLTKTGWLATGINNGKEAVQSLVAGSEVTAVFGEDGTVSGNGGCNRYSGPYTADGATIKMGPLVSTKMACADEAASQQEASYFAALDKVTTYAFSGDHLQLRSADGALQVEYAPTLP